MIDFEKINQQNDTITELSNVLTLLMTDRLLLDTHLSCELFDRYLTNVKEHQDVVERKMISSLLCSKNKQDNKVANDFLEGSKEIRRIVKQYTKKWCNHNRVNSKNLIIGDYDEFIQITKQMFELVLNRIVDETEKLYPLIRKL
ncbi:MAG: hypothetical protein DRQ51_08300 [Gammaproteobacteria bacterium]|nr:MAG: hypothetical protein DRQ51_08300 [Gammaproteobacteria bacterium]